ncbi:MAG: S8 family peptidase [Gammaproteobacteria bacterium]
MFSRLLPLLMLAWVPVFALQAAEFVAGELMVKYRGTSVTGVRSAFPAGASLEALAPGVVRVKLPRGQDPQQARARLAADPRILHVQPNYIKRIQLIPDDNQFFHQWGMQNSGQEVLTAGGQRVRGVAGADVSATAAWNVTTGDPGVVVAIIDTGVELAHAELSANLWSNPGEAPGNGVDDDGNGYVDDIHGWDWADGDNVPDDGNGHGTQIAGIIAARGNNQRQVAGLNWQLSVMVLRTFDSQGVSKTSDIVAAINYAVDNGARIINASYGTLGGVNRGANNFDQLEFDAYDQARARGVLVVAAACNEGINNDDGPEACVPASYSLSNILAVAATDQNDVLARFSNWGSLTVDLAAPGANIATIPWHNNAPDVVSVGNGTSVAAAFVSGAAALLLARGGETLVASDLRELLVNNVDPLDALAGIVASNGRLNVASALQALEDGTAIQGSDTPSSSDGNTNVNINGGTRAGSSGGGALLWLLFLYGWLLWRRPLPPY